MKKKSVVGLFLLLGLAACAPYMYGVPQESWDKMSQTERVEAMRVYERNEQARRVAAEERARTRAIEEQTRRMAAEEQARREARERDRIEAIYRGEGAYGDLIKVRLQGGVIRIGDRLQRYEPLTFNIANGETRRIEVIDHRGRVADLTVAYADGAFFLEGTRFSYEKGWERGRGYANAGTSRGLELRGADLFIEIHSRSNRPVREASRLVLVRELEPPPVVIRERDYRPAPTAPFINGKTLRWETDALGGQNGTIYVTSTKGSSFYLDQRNHKNRDAGVVKLEGKIKDGKIFIYNYRWKETWVGTFGNGVIYGKINNTYNFKIFE